MNDDLARTVTDLMAELTGRFEWLETETIKLHLPDKIDLETIKLIIEATYDALALAQAAAVLARPPLLGPEAAEP